MHTQLVACSWWPARVSKRRIDESKCRVRYLGEEAYDDVTDEPLLPKLVMKARAEELQYFNDMAVYEHAKERFALQKEFMRTKLS